MWSLYRLPQPMPGEKIIRIIHRDVFIVFRRISLFIILLAIPFGLWFLFSQIITTDGETDWLEIVLVLGLSVYLLFIWLLFFFSIIDYLLDLWVITDRRIIDIRQNGFFSRTISEQMLSKIQDISSDTHGFWQTIWKYGDLTVQNAGEKNQLYFEEISDPEEVRDMLVKIAATAQTNAPLISSTDSSTTPVSDHNNSASLSKSHDGL